MIPRIFRIYDYRSILDSGDCPLSADGITVLAGQNEAGKTAILTALRDFDLDVGKMPLTEDYMPENKLDANPRVSVLFEYTVEEIDELLDEQKAGLPIKVRASLEFTNQIWITRDLRTGQYSLDQKYVDLWADNEIVELASLEEIEVDNKVEDTEEVVTSLPTLTPQKFANSLRPLWPLFVYFDTFADTLPREIEIEIPADSATSKDIKIDSVSGKLPVTVYDFIALSKLDLDRLASLSGQDKALRNYLESRSTNITGDFLSYWKQTTDGSDTVHLSVKPMRSDEGKLRLQFYVHDKTDQYPEQRSRGFLWFLSFYLRLAAWDKEKAGYSRVVLVDEPGSYLHAKAQRDILAVLEASVHKQQQTFIYTTHSPYLLPTAAFHRFRIVIKKGEEGTKILDKLTHPLLGEEQFSDALTPFITNIGFDVRDLFPMVGDANLLVAHHDKGYG